MKTQKKRNKKYCPKAVSINPISEVFGGLSGDHAEHLQRLNLRNHAAMVEISQGRGAREHWDLLVGAVNMANVLCEQGIGNEFRAQTIAGRDALCDVGKRALSTGRFLFRGAELAAMNEALLCHDTQLENIRAIDIERAATEVQRRIVNRINTTNVRAELEKEAA